MVDDDYVTNLAKVLYNKLNPNLHVYVEYSNEVWNYGFSQASWALNQAVQMVNNGTWGPVLAYDSIVIFCCYGNDRFLEYILLAI